MAHECYQCGCDCYCNGDIDDCIVSLTPVSCVGCGCNEDELDDDYDQDDIGDWPDDYTDNEPIQRKN